MQNATIGAPLYQCQLNEPFTPRTFYLTSDGLIIKYMLLSIN